ncbi:leucyl aminopeptidase [Clostridium tertium]|uniref:Probable cytosol aminopeptidase n=1 Tax=Clostridium tertium TaxID=1559 RepID=A0A6N3G2F0_9CLOT
MINYKSLTCSTADALVIYLLENNLKVSNEDLSKNINFAEEKGLFNGKNGEIYSFTRTVNESIQTVVLVGLGKNEDLDLDKVREATGKGIKKIKELGITNIFLRVPHTETIKLEELIKAMATSAELASYTFNKYKTDAKEEKELNVSISRCGIKEATKEIEDAINEGVEVAKGIIIARDLVNEPSNVIYPETLAEAAVKVGKESGFEVEVHGALKIKDLKMEAFYNVAKGSAKEPKLIVMRYFGDKDNKDKVLGLVGKGLTYDSGGYSIKPTNSMLDMKSDMGGAASVIGALSVIAKRGLKLNVVAVIASCENLISGEAYKPGEVIGSMAGKTIEVVNTDAEGRLTLVDAIHYIITEEKVDEVIDLATLTGAALVALGETTTAVITNNEGFFNELKSASEYTGDKMWQLPAFDDYKKLIKSDIADLKNSGGRYAGTITAGLFIEAFVQDKPWLHLDIAGTAWTSNVSNLGVKGGTGAPVHTLYELAKRRSK